MEHLKMNMRIFEEIIHKTTTRIRQVLADAGCSCEMFKAPSNIGAEPDWNLDTTPSSYREDAHGAEAGC